VIIYHYGHRRIGKKTPHQLTPVFLGKCARHFFTYCSSRRLITALAVFTSGPGDLPSVPRFRPALRTLANTYTYSRQTRLLSFALMKRRSSGRSTPKTRLIISQQSSTDPSVTLFKLENPDSDDGDSEPGPSTPSRRSKRVKVEEIVKAEDVVHEELPVSAATVAPAADKGKKARSAGRMPSASPQKPKAIKQALKNPHPAPERWRETYDSIKEMRSRFPAPVDTMGCDTAKWKEIDPRVAPPFILSDLIGSDFIYL
jgi:hypothetical protein